MIAWTWLLQRVSGILLAFLLGVHLWRLHMAEIVTLDVMVSRFEVLIFIGIDLLLLIVGLSHGLSGLYGILVDFGLKGKVAVATIISLGMVGIVSLGVGGYALLRFMS